METSIDVLSLIVQASAFVKLVMASLLLASLLCWATIFRLSSRLVAANQTDAYFEKTFWSGVELPTLYKGVQGNTKRGGLEQIFFIGFTEYLKLCRSRQTKSDVIDGVERKLRVGLGRQQLELEHGLALLASIASVSPYVGLLGTVWGIMVAFMGLSTSSQATLAAVAPGIVEALIATALGLFAAIPAALAFNHFTAKTEKVYQNRALFCDEMTGMLLSDNQDK
ncbi:MotA/TolQ/ExbB proton channel [Moraxella macacae 0408225]|uniref:MotA/TolQ/ExbB proton channel n=1 Tax=Moraxella macacae 0408225 TaxID=1230338 RepID=L2F6J7_9GAMM|nr:protein TolQ [Moraxella macacae]ELA08421.1 MotA/TolQ/ExbB proton channel [Moraxella macacae 0408225]